MLATDISTATRVRYRVVAATVALAGVTYLDRVCVGVLAPSIMADLRITPIQMSFVFSAFTAAYALFEMPTAWWGDKVGGRRVLTRIVLWWSAFTMLTAAATSYAAMLAVRFLFGVGEAGAWPNAARVFSRWVPLRERGRVQGVFFAGAHLAGGFTPGLVALMALYLPWRMVFVALGFVGLAWAGLWYRWFRDEPREHPSVNAAEADLIENTRGLPPAHERQERWTEVFRIPSLIPLCLQYIANCYGYYFFITWLPTYLVKARGMASAELAIFSGLPLMLSAIADVTGGFTTDALCRRFGVRNGNPRDRLRGLCVRGRGDAGRHAGDECARRRNPDRRRRGVFDVHAGAELVDGHRPGRPQYRAAEFGDEQFRPGWGVLQPAGAGVSGGSYR